MRNMKNNNEEGRREEKDKNEEETTRRKRRRRNQENVKKNNKNQKRTPPKTEISTKNGAQTVAPKPSKKDTPVDGAFLFFLRIFDGCPRNHEKNSVFRQDQKNTPKRPIHQNSQKPQIRPFQVSFYLVTMRGP